MPVLKTYSVPCPICGTPEVNSWDKRLSSALGYKQIICESCIAAERGIGVDELRQQMWEEYGLLPCPGVVIGEVDAENQ